MEQIKSAHDVFPRTVNHPDSVLVPRLYDSSNSFPAPALEAIEYHEMDFDDSTTQFRGPPTEEREQAWLELFPLGHRKFPYISMSSCRRKLWYIDDGNTGEGILVETWAMPLLNRSNPDLFEKVQRERGDGYEALFEVHGQLGCLVSGWVPFHGDLKFHCPVLSSSSTNHIA